MPAQGNQAAAPRLVKVSGALTEFVRNSVSSSVEMTFAVYKDEVGGEALWTETQSVEVDKQGRYSVLLGATQAHGVPVELFPAGESRWLGVEIRGQAPQSRTLLVSVPYALKALDAEKLSGKSLSDFVLSESLGEQVRQVIQAQGQAAAAQPTVAGAPQPKQTSPSSTTTTTPSSMGPRFPPSTFSGTTSDQIVLVQQNQGCVTSDQNGLSLRNDKDKKTYFVGGDSTALRQGQHVALSGKKRKDSSGKLIFEVQRLNKDLGECQP